MSVHKRTDHGKPTWYYQIEAAESSREERQRLRKFGFATRKEAESAETAARAAEIRQHGLAHPADSPPTLDVLLENFFALHCEGADPLSPKTTQRYREEKRYLSESLLAMPPVEITRTHLSAEWKRLLERGGHTRRDKTPRPLASKTVRNIAGTVSSAYRWAALQGFVTQNPVQYSQLPKIRKRRAVTVASVDLDLVLASDGSFWCRSQYLAAADALGARRGELLALRWSDWRAGRFLIARNLIQVRDPKTRERRLEWKGTKEDEEHDVTIPASLVPVLEELRARQREFKRQFGPDYQDNDLIFCQEDGTPLWPDSVSSSISLLCRKLGLPKGTSLHSLRHTHASVLLEKGVPVAAVSKRLGHASIRTTLDIYGHVLRDEDDKAAQAYDDYRFRQRTKKQGEKNDDRVQ